MTDHVGLAARATVQQQAAGISLGRSDITGKNLTGMEGALRTTYQGNGGSAYIQAGHYKVRDLDLTETSTRKTWDTVESTAISDITYRNIDTTTTTEKFIGSSGQKYSIGGDLSVARNGVFGFSGGVDHNSAKRTTSIGSISYTNYGGTHKEGVNVNYTKDNTRVSLDYSQQIGKNVDLVMGAYHDHGAHGTHDNGGFVGLRIPF